MRTLRRFGHRVRGRCGTLGGRAFGRAEAGYPRPSAFRDASPAPRRIPRTPSRIAAWLLKIPYTICFCVRGDFVLMLHRRHPPNEGPFHSPGGKIEAGESALECVRREMMEEANMDVSGSLRHAGGGTPAPTRRARAGGCACSSRRWRVSAGRSAKHRRGFSPNRLFRECVTRRTIRSWQYPALSPRDARWRRADGVRCEYADGRLVDVAASPLASRI